MNVHRKDIVVDNNYCMEYLADVLFLILIKRADPHSHFFDSNTAAKQLSAQRGCVS